MVTIAGFTACDDCMEINCECPSLNENEQDIALLAAGLTEELACIQRYSMGNEKKYIFAFVNELESMIAEYRKSADGCIPEYNETEGEPACTDFKTDRKQG